MKERRQALIIATLIIALGLVSLFSLFEEVDSLIEHPASAEARRNDYLALKRLLEARGVEVRTAPALSKDLLTGTRSLIWLTEDRLNLVNRNDAVVKWVREGGTLVLGVGADLEEPDPIVARVRRGFPEDHELLPQHRLGPYGHDDDGAALEEWSLPLQDAATTFVCSAGDVLAAVGSVDDGTLAVVSDVRRYTSARLDDSFAGPLFWDVIRSAELSSPVLLVYGESTAGFSALIWSVARPLVISATVLLLVWLVHVSRRFGPRLPARSRSRRSLLEHVAATGSLLWRQGARDVLLESVRAAVRRRITIKHTEWTGLQDEELAPHLSELSALSPTDVLSALADPAPNNPGAFARQITHLQQLRAALGGST